MVNEKMPPYFDTSMRKLSKIVKMNQLTIEKRRLFYVKSGIGSLSAQIFLTDLLRGQHTINLKNVSNIVLKMGTKIKNYYHYHAWISTLIKVWQGEGDNRNIPVVFVCDQVHQYAA